MVKRLLSLLLALCMLFSLVPVTVLKAEAATGGTCGENIRWELTGKTLIISGSGDIPDFDAYEAPWADYISSGNSSGGFVTNIVIADGITSIGDYAFYGSCFVTSVTIASSVKRIGKYAFCSLELLETITIPSSVSIIDEYAFAWCYKLSQLVLPSSLEVIGVGAFYNCEKLTSVHIPANVREFGSKEFSYESGVFALCESIKEFSVDPNNSILTAKDGILFDKNMTYLIQYPLCSDNTEYIIPDGVTTIGYQSFSHCNNLKSLIIPSSVDLIQEYAFNYSPCLEKITFLGNAPEIYATGIFTDNKMTVYYPVNDSTWTADVMQDYGGTIIWTPRGPNGELAGTHGDNVTWMFDENTGTLTILGSGVIEKLFSGSSMPWYSLHEQITSVVVESGITEIPSYVFEYLEYVETISLPDTLTTLALNAFNDCGSLNNLLIPASVKTITGSSNTGYPAFIRCESLTDVYYLGTEDEWLDISDAEHVVNNYADMTMHYLVLHEDPPTCMESGTQSYYSFDDSSVYPNMYDLEKNIITELDEIPALNHTWDDGTVCKNCGAIGGTCGENLTWTLDEEGTLTISGTGAMTNYDMSSSVAPWDSRRLQVKNVVIEEGVTSIGEDAFAYCHNLTGITLPGTLTLMGSHCLYDCRRLTEITIPAGVESIGSGVFYGCDALTSIDVDEHNSNYQSSDGVLFDKECVTLICYPADKDGTEYVVPDGVSNIASCAFSFNKNLLHISLADSVKILGNDAFAHSDNLAEIVVSERVTSIGSGAFSGCDKLVNILVADNNAYYTDVNGVLFNKNRTILMCYPCGKTDTSYTIPNSVASLDAWAFYDCYNLIGISMPDGVTKIGHGAFANCDSLTEITVPNSVSQIVDYAFSDCVMLNSITFKGNTPTIGKKVFSDVMATAYYPANNPTWTEEVMQDYGGTLTWVAYETGHIHKYDADHKCECGAIGGTCGENLTWTLSDDGVLTVSGTGPMEDYSDENPAPWYGNYDSITSVIIDDGVTTIGKYAFFDCSSLISVEISDSVTTIGFRAFAYCTSMSCIEIPDSVITIDDSAFNDCDSLICVTVPDSVTFIGDEAFCSCDSLTNVIIGEGITTIRVSVFADCGSLISVTIPKSVITIGSYSFASCANLSEVFYRGAEYQKSGISFPVNCGDIKTATWHYEVTDVIYEGQPAYLCGKCGHYYAPDGTKLSCEHNYVDGICAYSAS